MDEGGKPIADKADEMMSEALSNIPEELRKRRSTRAVQAVPLIVRGVDALGRPFTERTATLIINCHGCRYQSKHYVLKNMWVTLEIPHPGSHQPPRVVRGRVAWIQRPRTVRQLFQVALELETPGNVWGIAFPPSDWFSFSDTAQIPAEVVQNSEVAAEEQRPPAGETDFRIPLSGADAAETNVRVFPSTPDAATQLTRQVARLVAEVRQQVQAAAQEVVSTERRTAIEDFQQKFASAREELSRELSGAIEKIQREFESGRRTQLAELAREATAEISAQRGEHARQPEGAVGALERALHQAEETAARLRELVEQSETQVAGRTAAAIRQAEEAARQQEQAQRELLSTSVSQIQQQAASALASAQSVWQKHLTGELEAAQIRWQIAIDNAVAGAQAAAGSSLGEQSRAQLAQLHEESARLLSELQETAGAAERQLRALEQSIQSQSEQMLTALARATEKLQQFDSSAARIETLQQGAADLESHMRELLNRHNEELERRSHTVFDEVSARIRGAFEESAREAVSRFGQQMELAVKPHVASAQETVERLAAGQSLVDAALTTQQERIRESTDEAFAEALANFRASLGSAEQSLQASTGTVAARSLAEFEEKVAGVKRLATEDLLKSAEWYEKKAQTQIHGFTEKACAQAATKLREKAAEISSIFGTELDHSSRTFLDRAQAEMEDMVRDAFERSRALFSEAADTISAAFIDEIQRRARGELSGFETEVQKSASASRHKLEAAQGEITQKLTAEQENFLRRFEASMGGLLEAGVAEVQGRVQAAFEPLLTSWKSMTDAHQAEMRDLYTRMGELAAEQYRGRLENVSKQWMLATVASLDQQSREVLLGVSSAAESKMRETFTVVFADMGEALRDRLRQIATNIEWPVPQKSS